jgi:hypothetical protein
MLCKLKNLFNKNNNMNFLDIRLFNQMKLSLRDKTMMFITFDLPPAFFEGAISVYSNK